MVHIVPPVIKKFYDEWNIQCFILISLSLQTILILCAPFRKRTRDWKLHFVFLSAHLLSDWVASLTIGLISTSEHHALRSEILALWASFLLLHLGGSDAVITSPLENNTLWLQYLVGLLNQVVVTILVFTQFPSNKKMRDSSLILFTVGTIKYVERTYVAYRMGRAKFRESLLPKPDPGPNYAKFMEEYTSQKEAGLPAQIEVTPELNKDHKAVGHIVGEEKLNDLEVLKRAFHFYKTFKGLIVDLIFSSCEREESREFFLRRDSVDAFKVLAFELNCIYEVLYTRFAMVGSILGAIVRVWTLHMDLAAYLLFDSMDKHDFHKIDLRITYILFYGAMVFDLIAMCMFGFNEWFMVEMDLNNAGKNWRRIMNSYSICHNFFTSKRINWGAVPKMKYSERVRRFLFRMWSESVRTYNLIDYCLEERSSISFGIIDRVCRKLLRELGHKDFYDKVKYVYEEPITKEVWDSIFNELKTKSTLANDPNTAKTISLARGEWVLKDSNWSDASRMIMSYIVDVDYDQSIIIWHIATDLCYTTNEFSNNESPHRQNCKILSDYMLYLLLLHPTIMLTITGIAHIRFRDTCAEAKNFLNMKDFGNKKEHEWACKMILAVNTDVEPATLEGNRSKSVLFDACILAKELKKLDERRRWKLMNEMWVELLSYAARHCRGSIHAAELSKGGELITFVWLLMVHLGLGDCFQIKKGHFGAKLVVGK